MRADANLSEDSQAGKLVRNRSAFGIRGALSLLRFFGQTKHCKARNETIKK